MYNIHAVSTLYSIIQTCLLLVDNSVNIFIDNTCTKIIIFQTSNI